MLTQGRGKTTLFGCLLLGIVTYAGWSLFIKGPIKSNIAYTEGQLLTLHSAVDAQVAAVHVFEGDTLPANMPLVSFDQREWQAQYDALIAQQKQLEQKLSTLLQTSPYLERIVQAQRERYQHYEKTISLAQESYQRKMQMGDFISKTEKEDSAFVLADRQAMLHNSRQEYHQAQLALQLNLSEQESVMQALSDLAVSLKHQIDRQRDHELRAIHRSYIHDIRATPGSQIQKGQPLLSYVPLDRLWVSAYFKETELPDIQPGKPVQVIFDAYPDQAVKGIVKNVSHLAGAALSPQTPNYSAGNFTRIVQRIPVYIELDYDDVQRLPHMAIGLSATVVVKP